MSDSFDSPSSVSPYPADQYSTDRRSCCSIWDRYTQSMPSSHLRLMQVTLFLLVLLNAFSIVYFTRKAIMAASSPSTTISRRSLSPDEVIPVGVGLYYYADRLDLTPFIRFNPTSIVAESQRSPPQYGTLSTQWLGLRWNQAGAPKFSVTVEMAAWRRACLSVAPDFDPEAYCTIELTAIEKASAIYDDRVLTNAPTACSVPCSEVRAQKLQNSTDYIVKFSPFLTSVRISVHGDGCWTLAIDRYESMVSSDPERATITLDTGFLTQGVNEFVMQVTFTPFDVITSCAAVFNLSLSMFFFLFPLDVVGVAKHFRARWSVIKPPRPSRSYGSDDLNLNQPLAEPASPEKKRMLNSQSDS